MRADLISIIEAAYGLERSDDEWLTNLVQMLRPHLDGGLGVLGYFYDASDTLRMRMGPIALSGAPDGFDIAGLRSVVEASDADYVRETWCTTPFALASELPSTHRQPAWSVLQAAGVREIIGINGVQPSGIGCWVGALRLQAVRFDRRERAKWSRVAAHIGSAARLRRRLAGIEGTRGDDPTARADAVMAPSGKLQHARDAATVKGARDALAAAAEALERSRGSLRRRSPEDAIEAWKGLVAAAQQPVRAGTSVQPGSRAEAGTLPMTFH